ncbi:hypothetical protein FWF89_00880 [Candidatus Saccharibacteria bacterium]|nr:hypothetical protein [Candidatus Saccharibacteria bacterium]
MFTGLFPLIKLILRRDRVKLPIWIFCFTAFLLLMLPLLHEMYGDAASLNTLFETFSANAAGIFLTGVMDSPTFGALMTIETLLWWGLAIAFLNILLIVRHTRQNEEMGAQELIQSCRVGRSTSLVAVLIIAFLTNLIITVALGIGMSILNYDSWSTGQAWLYAITMGLFGMVWAAITAIIVQLVDSARSAVGMMAGILGFAFLLRGVGDFMGSPNAAGIIQPKWFSNLTPFGWAQSTRALTHPDWLPILIPIIFIIVAASVAFFLMHKRDVGAGIFPSRKGRSRASHFLKTPVGLAWYIQKKTFIGWFVGISVFIAVIGALVSEMSSVFDANETVRQLIESIGGTGALIPAFLSTMLALAVIAVSGYTIQGLNKLRSEEASGYLENVLATHLSRIKWLFTHVGIVLFCGALLLALSGAIMSITANIGTEYNINVLDYVLAALSYFPMVLVFAGAYVLLFGLIPRAAATIVWVYYGFLAFATWVGPMIGLPQWIMGISLMEHFAAVPADNLNIAPLIVCSVVAIAAIITGTITWRNRNLTTS